MCQKQDMLRCIEVLLNEANQLSIVAEQIKAKENEKTVKELNQALVNLEQSKKNGIEQIFFKDLKIGIP